MTKKQLFIIIATAIVAALSSVLSLLTSCTAMLVTQKTPKSSSQSVTVSTVVDSTHIVLTPKVN